MWMILIWILPAILSAIAGFMSGWWGPGVGFAFAWIGFCIFKGAMILEQREFAVIERLGRYRTVFFKGWHVRIIGVDRIAQKGVMKTHTFKMYTNENGRTDRAVIDFKDASAPIDASVWYNIGNPDDLEKEDEESRENLRKDILKWTYAYDNPIGRMDVLIDSELRPRLQGQTIEDAGTERGKIEHDVMAAVEQELRETLGVYPPPKVDRRLNIEDIDLPEHVIRMRELVLEGEKEAQENEKRAAGYWKPIHAIQKELGVSAKEARAIYETQRGLETLREVRPKMNLVGKDFRGVLGTINLGGDAEE